MNDDEELRWVRRREGTHGTESRATRGYERDPLRDDDAKNLLSLSEMNLAPPRSARPCGCADLWQTIPTPTLGCRSTASSPDNKDVVVQRDAQPGQTARSGRLQITSQRCCHPFDNRKGPARRFDGMFLYLDVGSADEGEP